MANTSDTHYGSDDIKVLKGLEADVVAWRKAPPASRGGFSGFERARLDAAAAELDEAAKEVARAVEQAYRVLEACPQGRSAALYLANDLQASGACAALLSAYPSAAHARYLGEIEA